MIGGNSVRLMVKQKIKLMIKKSHPHSIQVKFQATKHKKMETQPAAERVSFLLANSLLTGDFNSRGHLLRANVVLRFTDVGAGVGWLQLGDDQVQYATEFFCQRVLLQIFCLFFHVQLLQNVPMGNAQWIL